MRKNFPIKYWKSLIIFCRFIFDINHKFQPYLIWIHLVYDCTINTKVKATKIKLKLRSCSYQSWPRDRGLGISICPTLQFHFSSFLYHIITVWWVRSNFRRNWKQIVKYNLSLIYLRLCKTIWDSLYYLLIVNHYKCTM